MSIDINFDKVTTGGPAVKKRKIAEGRDGDGKDEEEEDPGQLAQPPIIRNADIFRSKDPTAGQLFVFVGKSERGKTHFIKWLMYDHILRKENPIKFGLVFVRTKFKHRSPLSAQVTSV